MSGAPTGMPASAGGPPRPSPHSNLKIGIWLALSWLLLGYLMVQQFTGAVYTDDHHLRATTAIVALFACTLAALRAASRERNRIQLAPTQASAKPVRRPTNQERNLAIKPSFAMPTPTPTIKFLGRMFIYLFLMAFCAALISPIVFYSFRHAIGIGLLRYYDSTAVAAVFDSEPIRLATGASRSLTESTPEILSAEASIILTAFFTVICLASASAIVIFCFLHNVPMFDRKFIRIKLFSVPILAPLCGATFFLSLAYVGASIFFNFGTMADAPCARDVTCAEILGSLRLFYVYCFLPAFGIISMGFIFFVFFCLSFVRIQIGIKSHFQLDRSK